MSFTDEDLKRFSKEMKNCECGDDWHCVDPVRLKALIIRLEAAERCAEAHMKTCGKLECPTEYAWRKAAGKDA